MSDLSAAAVAAIVFVGALIYFLPWFVALSRGHKNTTAIFVLNVLLGWTLIGWTAAAVWALLADQETRARYQRRPGRSSDYDPLPQAPITVVPQPMATAAATLRACPHCASDVPVPYSLLGAVVACPFCRGHFTAVP